ncbi:MAG: carbohydrate kinase family protein [Hyphomonadaceae bacterium]|nr:carbohydrate kinase family protein [Clostridia bacterium]
MNDVTCLGILVADIIVPVNELPEDGKLSLVSHIALYTGGCAANTGIDLAKLGIKTAIIGKMGNDGFGQFFFNEFKRFNIHTSAITVQDGLSTSASVVMLNQNGERSFLHALGANATLTMEDIDFSVIESSKILFVAGALLMPRLDGEPTAEILKHAQERGVFTALDTAWDSTGRWMEAIAPCLPHLDLFIPSIEEAQALSGETDVQKMAEVFLHKGTKLVVIKMGNKGCYIQSSLGEKHIVGTYRKIKPVDTTGAGDSFVAGFLTGILKGWDLKTCGKFANAVGTHCIMQVGASAGIKSFEEIFAFMTHNDEEVECVEC